MTERKYLITRYGFRSDQRWDVRGGLDIEPGTEHAVIAYDARDVDPLVEAVRETMCDSPTCSRCAHLLVALKTFSTQPVAESSDGSPRAA